MPRRVTFSRNFTLSLSRTCQCYCKYCAFATHRPHLYAPEEVERLLDEGKASNYGAVGVSDVLDGKILPGMVVEGLGTFFLVWAIIGVAVNPRATKEWAALAIGGALGMAVMVFGPLTGASLNPARAFGPALVSGEWGGAGEFILVYMVAPVIGALVAGFVYFQILSEPGAKGVGGAEPVG